MQGALAMLAGSGVQPRSGYGAQSNAAMNRRGLTLLTHLNAISATSRPFQAYAP